MQHITRTTWAATVLVLITGCGAAPTEPVIEATLPVTVTETASPTPDATATSTLEPTITPYPSWTASPTPMSTLTSREPTPAELFSYLQYYFPSEGSPESFGRHAPAFDESGWLYEDVSGDGEADLIAPGLLYVAVMVWMGDHYSVPYQDGDYSGRSFVYTSQVYLEDWTGDGVSEVVYDSYDASSYGTAFGGSIWWKRIIHCRKDGCDEVWSNQMAHVTHDGNIGGMNRRETQIESVTSNDGTVLLKHYVQSFVLFCCSWGHASDFTDGLRIDASYVETYHWTGSTFELLGKEILQAEKQIIPPPFAPATNDFGAVASITEKIHPDAGNFNYECQLQVNGADIGELFGCRNFATIEWKDITGDGRIELVVIALSATATPDFNHYDCYHQRIIAYEWSQQDGIGDEIANVIGCVVQSDLYGVRLEDLNGDGIQEIIAAADTITDTGDGEWFEFDNHDNIYRWNGSEYVYSETVTRE